MLTIHIRICYKKLQTCICKKMAIFWDIMPRSPLKINQRFRGTCRLHLQDRRINSGFLIGLFLDPEDGGDMFLRNVS
jgi:hypothetical protein